MLDTGIDVPEVVNLVFFKIVRSKTKFWQMIGRGTRLCPDLFGPGEDKDRFLVFDFCQNFEFFNQNPNVIDGPVGGSISERLFRARIELIGDLGAGDADHGELTEALKDRLHAEVFGMNLDNFMVRPKRRHVERFQARDAWAPMSAEDRDALSNEVAGLPSAYCDDDLAAKQFDLLILKAQVTLLRGEGRAGWTWYTGAAAWAWRLGVEAILGLELCDGRLRITPCLPKSWGGCSAEITAPQGRIALRIEDPDGLGQGRSEMEIDGKPAQGNMVDFPTDGSVRQVWVRLRAARQSATQ